MAKTLVTGGAGFIGSHLVDALIKLGHQVLVVDNLSTGKRENVNPQAEFVQADLRDFAKVGPLFEGIDFVLHQAALPRIPFSIDQPLQSNEANITGTLNALVAAKEARVRKFIYASSSSVYGNQQELPLKETMPCAPLNPYALQKYVGELYCRVFSGVYDLPTVALRYFNVYGPRMGEEGAYVTVIPVFLRQKKAGEPLTIHGDGEQTRDFSHISDVVRANIAALNSTKVGKGEVINIGAGQRHTVNKIAGIIGGETIKTPARPADIRHTLADITLAKELLGWEPKVRLEEGIRELLDNGQ